MEIENVKVWFSKYGMTTSSSLKRQVFYIPMAKITYTDNKIKAKEISLLDCGKIGGFTDCTLTKKNYMGNAIGATFFCVESTRQILLYNAEGAFVKLLNTPETGIIVAVDRDAFVCLRNGEILTLYSSDGKVVEERQITDEEKRHMAVQIQASKNVCATISK